MRPDGKRLLHDSTKYAQEHRAESWWCLFSTLALYGGFTLVAMSHLPWWQRAVGSVAAGLVMVRLFILYHDYAHGTILKHSRLAWFIMTVYGLMSLNPPSIWTRSHNHHHKHNAKLFGTSIGSFPVMSTTAYKSATLRERFGYAMTRHPLTIMFGYATVFLYGMCIRSFIANPRQHFDSAVAIVLHAGLAVALGFLGVDVLLLGMIVPCMIAAAAGAYLFYAQHNYPSARLKPADQWSYVAAAMESSSYIKMNRLFAWITGNIGYHHIHHLNHHIPFYRLPEAMAGIPEVQSVGETSLHPRDVLACLRLKLWDPEAGRLVPFPARRAILPRFASALMRRAGS